MASAAVGTHPNGMHSCFYFVLELFYLMNWLN